MKKRVAVFFGGRSPEHDVSIVSALQAISAIDQSVYDAFPVYVTTDGKWLTGDILKDRANYFLDKIALKKTKQVTLDISAGVKGRLIPVSGGILSSKPIEFDIALLMFHGLNGEDGTIQGLFQYSAIAYTGLNPTASGIVMDKVMTKRVMENACIPVLPYSILKRPVQGYNVDTDTIKKAMGKDVKFPCILKPSHLGSSIGIAKVESVEEVQECLPDIFGMDDTAILEPFVENLTEYNVAVARMDGDIKLSAIERPKATDELLDFKQKYLSGKDNKSGTKTGDKNALPSEGMLSLTRELNPELPKEIKDKIISWSHKMFESIDGTGAPRIDYICNGKTGDIWLNEVNPIPGSYGFFLWEAAEDPLLFTELLSHLLQEAEESRKTRLLPADPVPKDARLFKRPL